MSLAADIVDGLTNSECRASLLAFLQSIERAEWHRDRDRYVRDSQLAAAMAERLAFGEKQLEDSLPRSYMTPQMVLDIRSAPSAKEAAVRLGIPDSTARCIRSGRSHKNIGAAA